MRLVGRLDRLREVFNFDHFEIFDKKVSFVGMW